MFLLFLLAIVAYHVAEQHGLNPVLFVSGVLLIAFAIERYTRKMQ